MKMPPRRRNRRGIGVFRRNNGPLNAAMVYVKIEVCWGSLRVAGARAVGTICVKLAAPGY